MALATSTFEKAVNVLAVKKERCPFPGKPVVPIVISARISALQPRGTIENGVEQDGVVNSAPRPRHVDPSRSYGL